MSSTIGLSSRQISLVSESSPSSQQASTVNPFAPGIIVPSTAVVVTATTSSSPFQVTTTTIDMCSVSDCSTTFSTITTSRSAVQSTFASSTTSTASALETVTSTSPLPPTHTGNNTPTATPSVVPMDRGGIRYGSLSLTNLLLIIILVAIPLLILVGMLIFRCIFPARFSTFVSHCPFTGVWHGLCKKWIKMRETRRHNKDIKERSMINRSYDSFREWMLNRAYWEKEEKEQKSTFTQETPMKHRQRGNMHPDSSREKGNSSVSISWPVGREQPSAPNPLFRAPSQPQGHHFSTSEDSTVITPSLDIFSPDMNPTTLAPGDVIPPPGAGQEPAARAVNSNYRTDRSRVETTTANRNTPALDVAIGTNANREWENGSLTKTRTPSPMPRQHPIHFSPKNWDGTTTVASNAASSPHHNYEHELEGGLQHDPSLLPAPLAYKPSALPPPTFPPIPAALRIGLPSSPRPGVNKNVNLVPRPPRAVRRNRSVESDGGRSSPRAFLHPAHRHDVPSSTSVSVGIRMGRGFTENNNHIIEEHEPGPDHEYQDGRGNSGDERRREHHPNKYNNYYQPDEHRRRQEYRHHHSPNEAVHDISNQYHNDHDRHRQLYYSQQIGNPYIQPGSTTAGPEPMNDYGYDNDHGPRGANG